MTEMADPRTVVNEGASDHPHTTQRPAKRRSKPQTVFRNASTSSGNFTIIPNALLQDERLRPAACRVLTYVLSLATDWDVNLEWLAKRLGIGRDRARDAVTDLEELGYARRWQERKRGSFAPYVYQFTDTPNVFKDEPPAPEKPAAADQQRRGSSAPENAAAPEPENPAAAVPENTASPRTGKPAPGNPSLTKKERNKDSSTKTPPVVPQPSAGGQRPRSAYLPDDWVLPEADRAWALQHAPQLAERIDQEVEAFRDWHSGKRRVDWSARWRTWCREAAKRAAPRPPAAAIANTARRTPAQTSGSHGVANRGDDYEEMRWLDSGTVAFQARRAELEREGLYDEVRAMDAAGRIRLPVSAARRMEASRATGSQPVAVVAGAIVTRAADLQHAQQREAGHA
jgi:hypothetical protein